MPVKVDVGARAESAVRAINEIRDALAAAGVAGKAFADIDFSKSGIGELANDLKTIEKNLKDLTALKHSTTGQHARAIFGKDPTLASFDGIAAAVAQHFPDATARNRFLNNLSGYVFNGTGFAPPPPGPPAPPKPRGKEFEPIDIIKSGILGGVGFFMAQAGLGSIAGLAGRAVDASRAETSGVDELLRRSGTLADTFGELREATRAAADGIHTNIIEMARYSAAFAAASGSSNGTAIAGARLSAGFAQGYGADSNTFVRGFGQASFMGIEPGRFAEIIGEAAARGSMTGKIEEVLNTVLQFTQTASRYSATQSALAGNAAAFGDLYGAMNASGSPALRGQNGAAVIGAIDGSIASGGGGGIAGQVLVMRAMMAAGMKDPNDIQLQLGSGAFGKLPNGQSNFSAIMGMLKSQYTGLRPSRLAVAAGQLFGINPQAALALLNSGYDQHGDMSKLEGLLQPYGGINGVNPTGLASIIGVAGADHAGLVASRKRILGQGGVSPETINRLNGAGNDDELKRLLVEFYAKGGMEKDKQTENTDALNSLTTELAKKGELLVDAINKLTDGAVSLVDKLDPVADYFIKQFSDSHANDFAAPIRTETYGSGRNVFNRTVPAGNAGDVLGLIAKQESANGADPNIYGFIDSTWVSDVRQLAGSDAEVGQKIAGMKDWQIAALKGNPNLQRRVAEFHYLGAVSSLRASKLPLTDLGVYAEWNFGPAGAEKLLRAPGTALLKDVLTPGARAAFEKLHGGQGLETVNDYKKFYGARGFSEGAFHDPMGGMSDGATRIVISAAPMTVNLQDPNGKTIAQKTVPIDAHTTASPYSH